MFFGSWTWRRKARFYFTEWYVELTEPSIMGYCLVLKDRGREYRFPFYGETLGQGGWAFMSYMVDKLCEQANIRW